VELLLEEYLDSEDVACAGDCLSELQCPTAGTEAVRKMVCMALERKDRDRRLFLNLLRGLSLDLKLLSSKDFLEGFSRVVDMVEEIVVDVPFSFKYFAHFLAFAITSEVVPADSVWELLLAHESKVSTGSAAKIAAEVLLAIAIEKGLLGAQSHVKASSKFNLKHMMKPSERDNFHHFVAQQGNLKEIIGDNGH